MMSKNERILLIYIDNERLCKGHENAICLAAKHPDFAVMNDWVTIVFTR